MKIIDEFTYKIILVCKDVHDYDYQHLKTFLQEELWINNEIDDKTIYYHLLEVVFKILNIEHIKNIFSNQLYNTYITNIIINNRKSFDYQDLWHILYQNIETLQMREKTNNEYIDLFKINVDGNLLNYSQYDNYIKEKNKQKQLKK